MECSCIQIPSWHAQQVLFAFEEHATLDSSVAQGGRKCSIDLILKGQSKKASPNSAHSVCFLVEFPVFLLLFVSPVFTGVSVCS